MSYLRTVFSDLDAIKLEVNNKKDKYNLFTCRNGEETHFKLAQFFKKNLFIYLFIGCVGS